MASTFTKLLYHVVFSTKHREPLIRKPLRDDLYAYMGEIIRGEGGTLLEIGGIADHVHLVLLLRTEPSVAEMVKTFKAKSSKWVNAERMDFQGRFSWQVGYAAFTVSPSQLPKLIQYVRNQEEHPRAYRFSRNS
jgi:putative transposase